MKPTCSSFGDIFDGSEELAALVAKLKSEAVAEIAAIDAMGGAVKAAGDGRAQSEARRIQHAQTSRRLLSGGEQIVVGVNAFTNSEPSPLAADEDLIHVPSAAAEAEQKWPGSWRGERSAMRLACARRC